MKATNMKFRFEASAVLGLTTAITVFALSPLPSAGATPPLPKTIVAVGDSISRGFSVENSRDCFFRDCPKYSWISGTAKKIKSHAARIDRLNKEEQTKVRNFAKTGAKVSSLESQLVRAEKVNADYTAVLIGANDACAPSLNEMTSLESFKSQFSNALFKYSSSTGGTIYVSSIPNILNLRKAFQENKAVQAFWKQYKVCPTFLGAELTEAELAFASQRLEQFNKAMEDACLAIPNNRCKWDDYRLYNLELKVADVSKVDYFHPSVSGQKKIAREAWKMLPWGK